MEATDRMRMARGELPVEGDGGWSALVGPELLDLPAEGDLELRCDGRLLSVSADGRRRLVPLTETPYPDLSRALGEPGSRSETATFDREELLYALKRSMAMTDKGRPVVRVSISGGAADVMAAGDGNSRKYRETIDAESTRDGLGCRFDPSYLADFLAAMDCGKVTLGWTLGGMGKTFEVTGPEGLRCVVSPVAGD